MAKKNYEKELSEYLCNALSKGEIPWERGWEILGPHYNVSSNRKYRGNNQVLLPLYASIEGWDSSQWGTFKNWTEMSDRHNKTLGLEGSDRQWFGVQKGSSSKAVFFWNIKEVDDRDRPGEKKKIFWKKWFWVFNREQTGLPPQTDALEHDIPEDEREQAFNAAMDVFAEATNLTIKYGGDQASYSHALHRVNLPKPERFKSIEERVNTKAHELIHSTGKALKRDMSGCFGDKKYAQEELVAEMGAALVCAQFGFDYTSRNNLAAYINSWLKALGGDQNYIVKVTGDVGKAVRSILEAGDEEE